MTKEDAIVWLNTDDYESAGFQKALEMAIKALEQEQQADNEWCTDCKEYDHEKHCCPRFSQVIRTTLQEYCENAVSREDVLLMLTGEDLPDDASKLISIFSERIKKLPLVKPEQKKGHWIYQTSDDYLGELNGYYECSECGRTVGDTVGDIYTEYPYCHCGAKMVKDGEK
jgi:hypothetical protein